MSKKLVVLCDMDAIVADLASKWYAAINAKFDDNVTVEKVTEWKLASFCKAGEAIYEVLRVPGFYRDLNEIPGARAAITELYSLKQPDGNPAFHFLFLTAASHVSPYAASDKMLWVEEKYPFIGGKNVITAYHKDLVKGDFLIDDSPRNLIQWAKAFPDGRAITIDYLYNRDEETARATDFRAFDYRDFERAWLEITWYIMWVAHHKGMLHKQHFPRLDYLSRTLRGGNQAAPSLCSIRV